MNKDPKEFLGKREYLYKTLKCPSNVIIPTNDIEAFSTLPKYNWVYDKQNICRDFGIRYGTQKDIPDKFPVIVKPYINLFSLSKGLRSESNEDFKMQNDEIWMEYITGVHESWDFILLNGNIVWTYCFTGYPDTSLLGAFLYWRSCPGIVCTYQDLLNWISLNFKGYTGCLNVEGRKNNNSFLHIDVHLRMGDVFYLPNRVEIGKSIISIYSSGTFIEIKPENQTTYLHPFFSKWHLPPELVIEKIKEEYDILDQYFIDERPMVLPSGGRRLFIGSTLI